jgi:excinuclease UvrABC nuclease subunit
MQTIADILALPSCSFVSRADLPQVGGVYFVVEPNPPAQLCYIGQAQNIRQRWAAHHRAPQMYPFHHIHWLACAEPERLSLEVELIRRFAPRWNNMTAEATISMLTSRLWHAEMEIRSLRFNLQEADRLYWRMAAEIARLHNQTDEEAP